ncbi:MAG: dienelactone hydrolase family protein, partial [Pseudomonadota bacterium]
ENIVYKDGDVELEAHAAWDDSISGPRPGILIAHAWGGRAPFECNKATALAELGYVGLAIDMYGKGVLGSGPEENTKLMQPFMEDRSKLLQRANAGLDALRSLDVVDNTKVGAIGFCFGGLTVLDLARGGADVNGVVSFHGLLTASGIGSDDVKSKVLVLHGYDDPMVPPEQVVEFCKEMSDRNVDWQLHAYGDTVHAFTNPEANDASFGTVYKESADARSWLTMKNFFEEIF